MSDSFTESTPEGFIERGKSSIAGVFFGLLLFSGAIALLIWNEHRAIKQIHTLEEGQQIVVNVDASDPSPGTDGRLVFMTGIADSKETLRDPIFPVSDVALRLKRKVEMYQWKEDKTTEGSGSHKTTTYSYSKVWAERLNSSSSFHTSGHENPNSLPFSSDEINAQRATIGVHVLSLGLIKQIGAYATLNVPVNAASSMPRAGSVAARPENGGLYYGASSSSPAIGDIRVDFSSVHPLAVSLVAEQSSNTFQPYTAKAGNTIELLETGTHDSGYIFAAAFKRNSILSWILRGVGWLLMFIGCLLILGPLRFLADMIPFIGSLFSFGMGMLAFLFSALLSGLIIAIAWIAVRPIAGAIALALVVFAIWGSFSRHKSHQTSLASTNAASASPPPLPPPLPR